MFNNKVTVELSTVGELLNREFAIPDYQRSFAWGDVEVNQLLTSLVDDDCHFLGNFILHQHEDHSDTSKTYNIVDGQQRLTCLLLAASIDPKYSLEKLSLPEKHFQKDSWDKLIGAKKIIDKFVIKHEKIQWLNMIVQITTVHDLDLAFTFFDAQNNAGLASNAKDILKARHLQKMDENSQGEDKQIEMDRLWSDMERSQDLTEFINICLYPIRKWTKGEVPEYYFENDDTDRQNKRYLLAEFGGPEILIRKPGTTIYPLPLRLAYVKYGEAFVSINLSNSTWTGSATMVLEPGEMFFRYIEHYYKIWKEVSQNQDDKTSFNFKQWIDNHHVSIVLLNRIAISAKVVLIDYYGENSDRILEFRHFVFSHLVNCRITLNRIERLKTMQFKEDLFHPIKKLFQRLTLNQTFSSFVPSDIPLEVDFDHDRNPILKGIRFSTHQKWIKKTKENGK